HGSRRGLCLLPAAANRRLRGRLHLLSAVRNPRTVRREGAGTRAMDMSKAVKFEQPMKTEPSPAVTFAAVVALAVVSTVTFAVLPNLVKGAQQSLHFSASDIGILAAMINAGGALGSVIAK